MKLQSLADAPRQGFKINPILNFWRFDGGQLALST
jgi:hypothetical protein